MRDERREATGPVSSRFGGAALPGDPAPFARFLAGTAPIDLRGIDWEAVGAHPIGEDVVRTLAYMQDVESHTVVFPRTFFSRRAVTDQHFGAFLVCWLYEEGMHGRALAKFLDRAGHPVLGRERPTLTLRDHVDGFATSLLATVWPDFLALHATWGAVHERTTIQAYSRLMSLTDHPVLLELLRRIVADEVRHFAFYRWQSELRLSRPRTARIVRAIMERLYTPVGHDHQPAELARWAYAYLFGGPEGRAAARRVDAAIAKLPGFAGAALLGGWLERHDSSEQRCRASLGSGRSSSA